MKRTLVAVALVAIFTLALAVPVSAFEHEASYNWDGTITFSQQAGHFCNTGAEMQQRISGEGSMTKAKSVYMEEGLITVADSNDWVTSPTAIRNLTVTTAIMLCAPAKTVYEGDVYNSDVADNSWSYANPNVAFGLDDVDYDKDALTDQIWAVSVVANPGFSGQVDMGFQAAYSPHNYAAKAAANAPGEAGAYQSAWQKFPYAEDWPGKTAQDMGPWYAGNYFVIEQFARTSSGTFRRYTDISSPWSHGYLDQNITVTGMAEAWEAYTMGNLAVGDQVGKLWWELF